MCFPSFSSITSLCNNIQRLKYLQRVGKPSSAWQQLCHCEPVVAREGRAECPSQPCIHQHSSAHNGQAALTAACRFRVSHANSLARLHTHASARLDSIQRRGQRRVAPSQLTKRQGPVEVPRVSSLDDGGEALHDSSVAAERAPRVRARLVARLVCFGLHPTASTLEALRAVAERNGESEYHTRGHNWCRVLDERVGNRRRQGRGHACERGDQRRDQYDPLHDRAGAVLWVQCNGRPSRPASSSDV